MSVKPGMVEAFLAIMAETARADSIIAGQLPAPNPRGRFLGPSGAEAHAQALVDQELVKDRRAQRVRANQLATITPVDATGNKFKKGLISFEAGDADFTDEDLNVLFGQIMERLITADPNRFSNESSEPTVMRIFGAEQGRGVRNRLAMFGSPSTLRRQREVSDDQLLNDAIDQLVRDALANKSGSPFEQAFNRATEGFDNLLASGDDKLLQRMNRALVEDKRVVKAVQSFFADFAGAPSSAPETESRGDIARRRAAPVARSVQDRIFSRSEPEQPSLSETVNRLFGGIVR